MKFENKDIFIKLGIRIAYFRKMRGYSQDQLAEMIGKSTSYLGQIEAPNLARSFAMEIVFDIARALNVPIYRFFQFEDD